jgi:AraC-like DNA-binding protein
MARSDSRNSAHYWWDRHLSGLSLMHADFTTHEYPLHTHDALVIAITEQGGSIVKSRGELQDATPTTLFVFNPEEPHGGWMGRSERWRYRSLYLMKPALDRLAGELGIAEVPYFTRNTYCDPDLIESFMVMHHALEEGRDVFQERELLVRGFGELFRRHGSGRGRVLAGRRDWATFHRVRERMRADHAQELRLEDLAVGVGMTSFQLIGLFKSCIGMTPHAYLVQIRLGMACRRLRQSRAIADVATSVGFYDQSALNRHFKRSYGITPLQFARAAAA